MQRSILLAAALVAATAARSAEAEPAHPDDGGPADELWVPLPGAMSHVRLSGRNGIRYFIYSPGVSRPLASCGARCELALPQGAYRLEVRGGADVKPAATELLVSGDMDFEVQAATYGREYGLVAGISGIVIAAAGAITLMVTGLMALGNQFCGYDPNPEGTSEPDCEASTTGPLIAGLVLGGTGGALAAVGWSTFARSGLRLEAMPPGPRTTISLGVGPWIGEHSRGFGISGRF